MANGRLGLNNDTPIGARQRAGVGLREREVAAGKASIAGSNSPIVTGSSDPEIREMMGLPRTGTPPAVRSGRVQQSTDVLPPPPPSPTPPLTPETAADPRLLQPMMAPAPLSGTAEPVAQPSQDEDEFDKHLYNFDTNPAKSIAHILETMATSMSNKVWGEDVPLPGEEIRGENARIRAEKRAKTTHELNVRAQQTQFAVLTGDITETMITELLRASPEEEEAVLQSLMQQYGSLFEGSPYDLEAAVRNGVNMKRINLNDLFKLIREIDGTGSVMSQATYLLQTGDEEGLKGLYTFLTSKGDVERTQYFVTDSGGNRSGPKALTNDEQNAVIAGGGTLEAAGPSPAEGRETAEEAARRAGLIAAAEEQAKLDSKPIGGEDLNEGQARNRGFFNRMVNASVTLDSLEWELTKVFRNPFSALPGAAGRSMTSDPLKLAGLAADEFVNVTLRRDSGAAINDTEFERNYNTYIPLKGESQSVVDYKRSLRQAYMDGTRPSAKLSERGANSIPGSTGSGTDNDPYVLNPNSGG
jgi:hypothetical protein